MTFIIMAQPKRKDADLTTGKTLSYGRDNEPSPGKLLFRGRATPFDTEQLAWDALESSLKLSDGDGETWPKKFQFFLVEIT